MQDGVDGEPCKFVLWSRDSAERFTLQAPSAGVKETWVETIGTLLDAQNNFLSGEVLQPRKSSSGPQDRGVNLNVSAPHSASVPHRVPEEGGRDLGDAASVSRATALSPTDGQRPRPPTSSGRRAGRPGVDSLHYT